MLLLACTPTPQPQATAQASPKPAPAATSPAPSTTAPAANEAAQADWALPGWITPRTTLAQLQARYGAGNVRKQTLPGPEGMMYDAFVLFDDDPTRRVELEVFEDNGVQSIVGIRIEGATSRWHDSNGLHPGMTLAELAAKNGKPIHFSGLYWDYGGTVQDWQGGKLAPSDNLVVYPTVILAPRSDLRDTDKIPSGEEVFRSNDPHWPNVGKDLVVDKVLLSWPDEDD
ncbi:MAG: hypothetical protein JSS52_08375 [Proteobacteria bacterium]|nr:hypothetical protein [Pseudomonadota bacterium]